MRGEVIDYAAGEGLISGDDGQRYSFTDADVARRDGLAIGAKVDFVPMGLAASQIYVLAASKRFQSTNEDLTIWGYFKKCIRLYGNGEGRARRKEYWSFILFTWLILVAAVALLVVPLAAAERQGGVSDALYVTVALICLAFLLVFLVPSITVLIRRLHDIGMSGWFALFSIIPYLGGLFVFIVALIPSQEGENRFGPYPKPRAPYAI